VIYIFVRATVDWADEQAVLAQLPPGFRAKVDLWNETFTVPYHAFRHEVRKIARKNLSAVLDAECPALEDIPEGALVLPVDDDDWFAPDIGRALEKARVPGVAGYYWISSFIEIPIHLRHRLGLVRRAMFPATPPMWICTTNNYAVVHTPASHALLRSHKYASGWFGDHLEDVRKIDERLSVMNRTLASQTSLGWPRERALARSTLLRKFRSYQRLYEEPLPPELAWCEPYFTLMGDLMRELKVRGPR
jgi:hypothetical protein